MGFFGYIDTSILLRCLSAGLRLPLGAGMTNSNIDIIPFIRDYGMIKFNQYSPVTPAQAGVHNKKNNVIKF